MDNNIVFPIQNPKEKANCFSKLLFLWYIKLCVKSYRKGLKVKDLYAHQSCDTSSVVSNLLEKNWKEECESAYEKQENPSLYRAIHKTFAWRYTFYSVLVFLQYAILRPLLPLVLSMFILLFIELENGTATDTNFRDMCTYGSLVLIITLLVMFLSHHTDLALNQLGMRVRIACSSLIYRKLLRLSNKSLDQSTSGQVVNLLSNDVNRFDIAATYLPHNWIMPFLTAIVAVLIWWQMGIIALIGVISVFFFTIPVHVFAGRLVSSLRLKIAIRSDNRIRKMAEIVSGIRVIKMYAWEIPFAKVIRLARKNEIKILQMVSYLRGVITSSFVYMQRAILLITIVTYISLGKTITPDQVFSMSLYFSLLQMSMAIFFPLAISLGAEAMVSIGRLEEFLMLDEKFEPVIYQGNNKDVVLKNIHASWIPEKKVLTNISINVKPGTLCAIVGPVGVGKSSVLQLLLGELIQEYGVITVGGSISYASQEPWLFASTVRKNILFGEKYDPKLYKMVCQACALTRDFELLPNRDQTMVGERGISLSGGQKARINLARAVYKNADIYLLDDPLSAVDTHVGKKLFEDCISEYLKHKTRILITHQLQYLKKADHIVVLNNGRVEAQGTFEELQNTKLNFTKILVAANTDEDIKETPHKESIYPGTISIAESLVLYSMSEVSMSAFTPQDEMTENNPKEKAVSVYLEYAKAGGGFFALTAVVLLFLGGQVLSNMSDFWLTIWTSDEALQQSIQTNESYGRLLAQSNGTNKYLLQLEDVYQAQDFAPITTSFGLTVYSILTISSIVVLTVRSLYYYKVAMNASQNLHDEMFRSLLQTPMRFFDSNPCGRILNRFSRDMGIIDELLPRIFLEALQLILVIVGVLVMICITNPYIIIVVLILSIFFRILRRQYVTVARHLKLLEGTLKSPVFSHVSATLNGIATIRASKAETKLEEEFDIHQDSHTSAWYLCLACIASFGIWIDLLCFVFISFVVFGFILASQYSTVNGSYVGLAVSQALMLIGIVQYGIRQCAELVSQMTSVERVLEYTKLEKETPLVTPPDQILPIMWPHEGRITFSNVSLKYSKDELPVLKELNFVVNSGEKIGIVGRTGAGKSSLISALFLLAPVEGSIEIDDIDIKLLGLNDLRRKLSIIPQEPVLFSSTLRYNLDPFDEYTDSEIWNSLDAVEMKTSGMTLDFMLQEGGSNFSVGQRQLLCLARAVLRKNKILIMDEATANVDPQTDTQIQNTIRHQFQACTVLTIAHRLHTIMDSDKVLVMDAGMAVEYEHPHVLLQDTGSFFSRMVSQTNTAMQMQLRTTAEESYNKKHNSYK